MGNGKGDEEMTTLDDFLKALDEINDYCEAIQDNEDGRDCCSDCILKDYCLDIPTHTSFASTIESTKKAIELISQEEAANEEV